jgi:hypothetical protein
MIEEEVISTEPVQEQPYKKKVYDILSSNFDDFKLGEQDFYKKLSTDKTYAGKVHDVLIENFSDFKKPKNEFIDSLTFVEPVKKKDQIGNLSGEVSSPIQSQLPKDNVTEWYKQTMPDAMFVKSTSDNTRFNKPKEMAEDVLYKAAAPIRAAKKKADTEIAIKNTAENYFKNNNIDAPIGSALYNKQVAELKTKVENGDAVLGVDKTNDKLGLKKTTGFWSSLQSGFNNSINANNEAAEFVGMSPEQKVEWVKNQSKTKIGKEGYIGEAPDKLGAYGEFLGGAGPMVAKTIAGATVGAGLAAVAPETGGLSMAGLPAVMAWAFNAQDMASQGVQKEIMRRYEMIKSGNTGISDVDAMEEASSGQTLGEIAGLVENTAFMMPASRVINPVAKSVLRSGIENTLKSAIKVGTIVSATEAGKKVVAGVTSKYGETPQEILGNSALDFAENATVGALLHISTMGAVGLLNLPKVVQSGIKYALRDVPKQDIDNVLKANVNIGNIPVEVAEKVSSDIDGYKEAADKAMPGLSPEAEASQIGLIQKKNKLVEESKTKDDSVKPVYKEQIESIDNKINDLNKGKPVYDVETDELTGNKYNKDKSTEYISIEELPKEEAKAEVKVEDITSKTKNEKFDTPTLKSPASNYEKLYVPRNVVEEAYKNDKDNNPVFGTGDQTLNRIIERGGYSIEELDNLLPNWKEVASAKEVKPTEIKEEIKVEEPVSTQKVKIPGTKQSKPIPLSDFTLEKEGERTFTKRIKKDEGGVSGVEPLNQFKLNQGMDAYGNPYPRVHIILDNAEAEKYQASISAGGKKVAKYPEFRDEINKIAKANRSKTDEVVLDFRKSEIDLLLKKPEKVIPAEIAEIPLDLQEKGELIESTLEAERRRSNGEKIFAITEQDETPVEVTSVEMLRNYTPDQLIAYKPSEIIKNKELQENKLILQNGTKKQGNGKDTGAAIGGEMGGLEPSGKGAEVGLGAPSRYVVGKSDRVVRDVTTVKKISIPDSEAAEIKKVLPNAIFDDSFSEINSAEQFRKAISKSLKGNKHSSSVFVYPIEEYKNSRLFLTNDGKAGVAITKDGDIISVFSYGEGKNRVAQLLVNAVKDGGVSLDHYDTRLTNIYSQFGFVPVARVKFDRAEAPKTWDYDLYKDYNNGEPDVIAMAYNGGDPNTLYKRVGKFGNVNDLLKKTPYVNTWEQAKKLQQEFVNKVKSDLEPSIEKDVKTQIEDFGVPKEDVEPVNAMLSKIHENLKKAGLTATNTLSEWVGIGKGTKEKGALYQPTVYGNSGIVKRPSFDKTSADKAIKSGRVKVISPKESLEDFTFAITHWDDLFVGDIYHDGKKIGSFDGGVFYPLNGGEKGKMGASVNPQSAGAFSTQSNRSLFKNNGIKLPQSFEEGTFIVEKGANKNEWVVTNKAGEKVNITMPDNPKPGVIVIGKGDNLKHKSSLSAKVGFVNTLLSYAKNKEGYDGLINAVKSVYSIGNTRNADSVIELFNNYLKSGRMADGQTMSEAKTSYENFRAALIKDANQIVTSMMRDMGYTGAEYFDATQLKKGIYKATGKGIDKMFADIGQEDFLKGLKTGDAYAALKVTSPVFFEKDLGHPSYPFAIKTVDGSPVNIDIFDKTFRTFGENQGIEGRLPKEGQTFTEGFGVTTTTKPSYKLKKDIDLSQPSSSDLSGALGQYESIRRFRKEGEIISKKGEYDYALKQKANAQYRIENGKNIIEALREFNKAKDKGKAVVAITHEIMHPTVVEIINGSKEGNEIGKKYTQTIVDEFNKATDNNITVDELIKGNDEFKNGKTTKQYRDVQEFIAESWEKYHTQGAKGFSAEFQKVLKTITEAFKSVYNSLTEKELTPELKRMFDDILGKSEFKAKKKILSEDISKKTSVVFVPEGADDSYIKMANVVNDAFVGNKFGLDALDQITSKLEDTNLENVIQKVKDKIKLNPNLARETRERLLTTKQGNEFDQAVLMYDLARLKGRENELQQEIINTKNPKKIQEYQKEILQVQNEMMDNAMANKQIGRTASTIFRLRQLWVNKELTILDMMDEYKASKGIDELTPEQEQEVKDAYNQIKESRAKLEEAKLDLEKSREETAKLMIENQKLKELQEKSNEIKKAERAEKTSETIKKSNERVTKALDNLKKLGGQATAGFDPKIAVELSKIAAEKVYQGIVKFDELVQNVLEDIKDVLPDFTKEDVINHILTRVNKAGQLEPMLLSAQYNNIKKSLDKSKGTLRERVEKYELAQKEVAKQQFKWQEGRRQDMLGNEPIVEKIGDKLLRFQRFAVLSYPITMVKLAAVVAHQLIALKPLKFAIGKLVYALTPKNIREKQSIWGDPKWSSIAKYYSEWVRNFSSTNFKEIMSGVDTKELLYGRPIMYDELNASGSFLEIPGRSHGFIKSFIKNPEFVYAHEQQMVYNLTKMAEITEKLDEPNLTKKQKKALQEEYDSYDVTNEDVIEKINRLALLHGKWAILMNDNKFVDKFRQFTQNTGLVGKIAQSELPIVKIPVNWVGRAFATKYGIIRSFLGKSETETKGKGKLPGLGGTSFPGIAELIFKGTENLTESQAELLGKSLQLGTMGMAFYALGYYAYKEIEKNEDGSYEIMGVHVPKVLVHIPEYESIISGAETAHKKKGKDQSFIKSYIEADAEIAANNPFLNFLQYGASVQLGKLVTDIANPKKKDVDFTDKASDIMAKKIADMVEPGFVKTAATSFDTKEGKGFYPMGEVIKRRPSGETLDRAWEQFELGIPGLRQNVSKEEKAKRINEITKRLRGQKYDSLRGKIIENLKKIPN